MNNFQIRQNIRRAAIAIRDAHALLIGAGAGIGVDSGLPDFRGNEGFWRAYPALHGQSFIETACADTFRTAPRQAWGFYGHRLGLYRDTVPHEGFSILRDWCLERPRGHFVFTSNVDGQFFKAGFDESSVIECHGSIHWLQCQDVFCKHNSDVWSAHTTHVTVDLNTLRAKIDTMPRCKCGKFARPTILMFGDGAWNHSRTQTQNKRYWEWKNKVGFSRTVAIEIGAGTAIPSVRNECRSAASTVIRINPRECETATGVIPIPLGSLDAIKRINDVLWSMLIPTQIKNVRRKELMK